MKLRTYYFIGLIPLVAMGTLLNILKVDLLNITIYSLSFFWPYAVHAPGLREKVMTAKYRFSFLRFSIFQYEFFYDLFPKYKNAGASIVAPLLLGAILWSLADALNPLFIFFGLGTLVITLLYFRKEKVKFGIIFG